jgi:tetratricopeptide (TPR) repeat protein
VRRQALRLDRRDPLVLSGLASLAASRHDFRESLRLARRVVALAPDTARGYGLLGDALLELGRYRDAFRAFDRMVELKPSLGGYARIAYARELLGRPRDALDALELAHEASGSVPEPTAWTLVEIGKLHFSLGELGPAAAAFRAALAVFPGDVYALDGLAKVEAARGRSARAVALARRAADAVPLPQLVTTLVDLHLARGATALAREQLALVGSIERLLAASGVDSDLELALFRTDHGIRLRETLELARSARADRPTIQGDDVLAWTLARNDRCGEALSYSKRSLRLGTKDASLYFHRGMIERCLGHGGAARLWFRRALATNPHFSLVWSSTARRLAR